MSRTQKPLRSPFTDLEQEVMSSVWRRRTATAEQIRQDLAPTRKLQESTVRTLLGRLENKGHLKHKVDGRTYVYSSVDEPRNLAIRAVRQIIERFCAGSAEPEWWITTCLTPNNCGVWRTISRKKPIRGNAK
jgi:predicted transcriptional regulator